MSKTIYDFRKNAQAVAVAAFVYKVNEAMKLQDPKSKGFAGLGSMRDETSDHFEAEAYNKKTNSIEKIKVKRNGIMPSTELFSLYQTFVRPADEPFAARNVFAVDTAFHPGSKYVGFDVISEEGEALLVATGQGAGTNNAVDFSIGRIENFVAKITAMVRVLRDDVQEWELRNSRGMGPSISALQEKMRILRKSITRTEDNIIWLGGNIKGVAAGKIDGVFDFLSANTALNGIASNDAPSKGAILTAAAAGADSPTGQTSSTKFKDKAPRAIIADFLAAAQYLTRKGAFIPTDVVMDFATLTQMGISMIATQSGVTLNQTPIIKWIREAFKEAFGSDLTFHGSNYMNFNSTGATGTNRPNTKNGSTGFLMLDSRIEHQAIAVTEEQILLPSILDANADLTQVGQLKTGGFQCKHPASMVYMNGIGDTVT